MSVHDNTAPDQSANSRWRTLGRLALEVFSIVLGVLLALGVSEWQEDRDNRERAGAAQEKEVDNEFAGTQFLSFYDMLVQIEESLITLHDQTIQQIDAYLGL